MSRLIAAFWIILMQSAAGVTAVFAGEVLDVRVSHERGQYQVSADVLINAPAAAVKRRLTDYANLTALNPSILKSEVLEAPRAYDARVRTLIKACVLMHCQTLRRVEDVRESAQSVLAVIVPRQGEFSSGRTHWKLEPRGESVLVRYRAEFVPDFTLPPVIGPSLVRQALKRELRTVLERLEHLARSSRSSSRTRTGDVASSPR
jgi:hypothetical protein